MKPAVLTLFLPVILLSLNACRNVGPQAQNVGPFDRHGNYVEAWADDPSKWRAYQPKEVGGDLPVVAMNEQPPPHSVPLAANPPPSVRPVVSNSPPKPKPVVVKPKPKPKPVVVKPKPKPKPLVRYTIKKGDNLSTIAARHGTSVTALKKANGLSGTLIIAGKTLVIPRGK
jgi:outer membrane biosynthesis protein TonB